MQYVQNKELLKPGKVKRRKIPKEKIELSLCDFLSIFQVLADRQGVAPSCALEDACIKEGNASCKAQTLGTKQNTNLLLAPITGQ